MGDDTSMPAVLFLVVCVGVLFDSKILFKIDTYFVCLAVKEACIDPPSHAHSPRHENIIVHFHPRDTDHVPRRTITRLDAQRKDPGS